MTIDAFRLTRFRGFEDTDWVELRPLSLFLGHNSSGKSTLLASLLMLRQSVLNPDRSTAFVLNSDVGVDLGSYEDLVFGHRYDPRHPLSLALRLTFDRPYSGWTRQLQSVVLHLQIGYDKSRRITYLHSLRILTADGIKLLEIARERARARSDSHWRVASDAFTPEQLPDPAELSWEHFLPLLTVGSRAHESVRELCQHLAQQIDADFRAIVNIGPLRTEPARIYYFTGESVTDVGKRGENTYKLLAAVQYQGRQHELDQRLNWWLRQLGYELNVRMFTNSPLLQIGVRESSRNGEPQVYNLKDVGFGISQVLPVLVQCYAGETRRLILLEQPELHLHPRAQSELGDLLIDATNKGNRFLIETHSEHLLLRLRRRIAETGAGMDESADRRLRQDQLRVYFVERRDGRSLISPIEVSDVGQITDPPEGFRRFFSDDYEEVMAISEVMARKHQN